MRLFSYLSMGQVRSARQIGDFGIDLHNSAALSLKNRSRSEFDGLPISMLELLGSGPEGMKFAKDVTDWVLETLLERKAEYLKDGVIFILTDVHVLAPIPVPGKVICIAGNYPAEGKLDKPEYPTVFLKPSSSVIGDRQGVVIPKVAVNVAYEVELAVVIGRRGRDCSPQDAMSVIAGYTIANDLGDRVLEKRTSQWTSGKMFDTFTPMGPILVTPDELNDAGNLHMFTTVNDRIVQKGNTSQMFFDVPQLVSYLSTLTTMEPGDVILTGSPKLMDGEPNPLVNLKPGDVVEVKIEQLSSLINPVINEQVVL